MAVLTQPELARQRGLTQSRIWGLDPAGGAQISDGPFSELSQLRSTWQWRVGVGTILMSEVRSERAKKHYVQTQQGW